MVRSSKTAERPGRSAALAGIAGYVLPRTRLNPDVLLDEMLDALAHRGSGAVERWVDGEAGVGLGRRGSRELDRGNGEPAEVSTRGGTDLGHGRMGPMGRDGRWVVTLDGEIFNRAIIAAELGTRLEPVASADPVILAEAFQRWGIDGSLDRLDAAFAFAAWDRIERRLVLGRDRLGERPLVYTALDGGLSFSSELGALRTLPGFDSEIDRRAVALFLRFKYVPSPWTIHRGSRKLPAGHLLVIDAEHLRGGQLPEPRPWWSLADRLGQHRGRRDGEATATSPVGDREHLDRLDEAVVTSVRRRLDPSVGAFLSGGIDSTLVASVAAEQGSGALRTFTVGSDDPDHDETTAARAIAARLGSEHTEAVLTESDARSLVPDLASRWDEPFADSSALPTLFVSTVAARETPTVLSGDGGDEFFGGYNRHRWLPSMWNRFGRLPAPLRRGAGRVLRAPGPARWDRLARVVPEQRRPRLLGLKAEKLALILGAADVGDAYGRLVSHWQDPTELLVEPIEEPVTLAHDPARWPQPGRPRNGAARRSTGADPEHLAEQLMAVDALTYLPDDVLVKVDRATAAAGVTARSPLLGVDVVNAAAELPIDLKIRSGVGKWALRELIARRIPRDLIGQPKSGFGVPIAAWLRGPLRPWAEDLLSDEGLRGDGLLDPGPIRAAWVEHLTGAVDRSYELWDVLMLTSWLRGTNR